MVVVVEEEGGGGAVHRLFIFSLGGNVAIKEVLFSDLSGRVGWGSFITKKYFLSGKGSRACEWIGVPGSYGHPYPF